MMRNIRPLSPRAEFVIVVAVAFGLSVFGSLNSLFFPGHGHVFTDASLVRLTVYQAGILLGLGWFLWAQGWTAARLGFAGHWSDPLLGFGLAAAAYIAYFLAWRLFALSLPGLARSAGAVSFVAPNLNPAIVAVNVILNPVFEETFVSGYVISALREKNGPSFALNVSVAIRLLYHLYQGIFAALFIIPLGLVLGYAFVRTRRLWPLIVAHGALDAYALLHFVKF
jgi:CAAX protease family protein